MKKNIKIFNAMEEVFVTIKGYLNDKLFNTFNIEIIGNSTDKRTMYVNIASMLFKNKKHKTIAETKLKEFDSGKDSFVYVRSKLSKRVLVVRNNLLSIRVFKNG